MVFSSVRVKFKFKFEREKNPREKRFLSYEANVSCSHENETGNINIDTISGNRKSDRNKHKAT